MTNHTDSKLNATSGIAAEFSLAAFSLVSLFPLLLLLLLGLPGAAAAQNLEPVQVYATSTNVDTGPNGPVSILDLPGGPIQGVYLWAAGGSEASTGPVCTEAGTGSPLCGIAFTLSVTGGYQLLDFQANPDFDGSPARLPFRTMLASPDQLVGNAFDLGEPGAENRYLGLLRLQANGANGDSQVVVSGSAIGADLTMRQITTEPIIVPEPAAQLMLGTGALGLLGFARRRVRR
jgi:hypothetical protein